MAVSFKNLPTQQATKNAALSIRAMTPVFVDTTQSANGNVLTSEYVLTLAAANDTRLYLRREYVPSQDKTRCSVRVITDVTDDALAVPEDAGPYEVVIAWNHPGGYALDTEQLGRLIQMTVSLVFENSFDGTTGLPSVGLLNKMALGITKNW